MFSLFLTLNHFLNNVESKIEPFIRPSIEYGILYRHCQAWYQITWLEYSNEFLSLPSSSIHNSQYFSWICGLVVLYRAVGTGGTGGTISPPPLPPAFLLHYQKHNLHHQKVLTTYSPSRFSDLPTVLLYVHLLNPIFFYPLASAAAQCQYYVLYLLRIQFFACNVCILRMNNWKCNIAKLVVGYSCKKITTT